jgi:hypothetical protein
MQVHSKYGNSKYAYRRLDSDERGLFFDRSTTHDNIYFQHPW